MVKTALAVLVVSSVSCGSAPSVSDDAGRAGTSADALTDAEGDDGSVSLGLDLHGIQKIYPDAMTVPEQQYLDENDPTGGRIDNIPDTYEIASEDIGGGRNAVEVGGTSRLALYSSNGNPFGSVEHTFYVKFISGPNGNGSHNDAARLFQPYVGGGSHHTAADRCCEGNSMKVCLFGGGDIAIRKEICHPAYAEDRGSYNNWAGKSHGTAVWNGPIMNMQDGMLGRWWGFKQVELHLPDRNRQEVWIDEGADDGTGRLEVAGNEARWRLLARYDDVKTGESDGMPVGDWTTGSFGSCGNCVAESRDGKPIVNGMLRLEPYSVSHPGAHDIAIEDANAVVLRIDGDTVFRLAYWSARKIEPEN
ncbi:MAG: hypothetical protein AB7O24_10850 [Kofleriaceae bacterium]